MRNFFLAFLAALLIVPQIQAQDAAVAEAPAITNPARPIIDQMIKAMSNVQTLSGRVKRRERIGNKLVKGDMRFKVMMNPYKVYIYNFLPEEGVEVLYVKGWNNNKAVVNPNGFPWVNVSLDPYGGRMLENQHHTLHDVGFEYTNRVVKHVLDKYPDDFDKFVTYEGKKPWYGSNAHVIKISYGDFKLETYTMKNGETLFDVDKKLKVPAYRLIELNDDVDDFDDVSAGQKIKVPNVYAKEIVLMVDEKTFLPIMQMINDDKGLFEKYEYHELIINPRFKSAEFTEDYPDYGF